MNERKRGISLITLIITIIVIIILAGAVILSLNNTNIIDNANKAVSAQDRANIIDAYNLMVMDNLLAENTENVNDKKEITLEVLAGKVGKDVKDLEGIFQINAETGALQEKNAEGGYDTIVTPPVINGENKPVAPVETKFTRVKEESKYNKPYVPEGFEYLEGTWDTGLVIKNTKDKNEFVWVPLDGTNVKYEKKDFDKTNLKFSKVTDDTMPEANSKVTTYGGFYIGRYEAGIESKRTASGDASEKALSQKDKFPYNFVTYTQAKGLADGLYNNVDCISGLTTGIQWDTALIFIGQYGDKNTKYPNDSTGKGNYSDSDSQNNPAKTGDNRYKQYVLNNIYDMAGNTYEWTNEIYSSDRVFRGGAYDGSGSSYPAGYRNYCSVDHVGSGLVFRISLYIK